jgi:hypothetical protein
VMQGDQQTAKSLIDGYDIELWQRGRIVTRLRAGRLTMTALDTWAVTLCCPHCGRTGTGTVSEDRLDGDAEPRLHVENLSSGFVAVELRPGAGQDIRCITCNSSALK